MAPRGSSAWRRPYTTMYNNNYKYGTGLYNDTLSDIEKRYAESISKTKLRSDRPDLTFSTFAGSNLASSPAPRGERRENPGFSRQISSPSPVRETARSPTFENRLNATLKSAAFALDEEVQDVINSRIEKRRQAALEVLAKSESENALKRSETEGSIRPRSLYDDSSFWSKTGDKTSDFDLEMRRSRKKAAALDKLSDFDLEMRKSRKKTETSDEIADFDLEMRKSRKKLETVEKFPDFDLEMRKSRRKAVGRHSPTNGPNSPQWRDKSRELQDQVDSLESSMSDVSSRLRSELSSLKAKNSTELSELSSAIEISSEQANDIQRTCKRHTNQIQELQSSYDSAQRNIEDALEEMSVWQNKCKSLKKEMDRLREEIEQAVQRSIKS